jgi:hypothetical protein
MARCGCAVARAWPPACPVSGGVHLQTTLTVGAREILPLRDDAFKTHFASVREDGRAVAFDMLVEPDAGTGLGQDRCAGENITITRSVRHKRGSWWQLPKDFQKEQPEDD